MEPASQQTYSDDQELAKVLAGVSQQADNSVVVDAAAQADQDVEEAQIPTPDPIVVPTIPEPVVVDEPVAADNGALDGIKQQALNELRPLVDKLDVSSEEKFDTYLLLIRSTDDRALIGPAHEAAKGIADEARRAQALLDIIKEIDFLSQNQTS